MSIHHQYPLNQPNSGVSLYGQLMHDDLEAIKTTIDIHHFELGYNEYELFWRVHKLLRQRINQKIVLTLHDPPVVVGKPFTKYLSSSNPLIKVVRKSLDLTIGRHIIKTVLQKADKLIVLNTAAVTLLAKQYAISSTKIATSHLPSLTPQAATKPLKHEGIRLLYFGNISQRKGLDVLIKALRLQISEIVTLDIVGGSKGNETYLKAIQQQASELPNNISVNFHGFVKDSELAEFIGQCDIIVLPYRDEKVIHASGPLASAMHAGRAIICSRTPIFGEVIDGQTGLLFDQENSEQLAGLLQQLLVDPVERQRLGKNALAWSQKTASQKAIIEDIKKVYDTL